MLDSWLQLCGFVCAVVAAQCARAAQIHVHIPVEPSSSSPAAENIDQSSRWNFDAGPSQNVTTNLIFDGVSSLLQQWANTHYRNGHNIVPATMPAGTLLYHGTYQDKIPTVPEWAATDPEHSYLFCRSREAGQGCWQLTLVTTRPLNLLYFDGSSAAKMALGSMDSQDLLAWGEVVPERTFDERGRIEKLCEWGKKYNLDGFMRMEMDFEVMLCDFTQGVEPVSFLNLVSDTLPGPPGGPPERPRNISSEMWLPAFRVLESGQWHNQFPGETRVNLDLTRLISFYDVDLFPSLVHGRYGQERWEHRLQNITKKDRDQLLARLDDVLGQQQESGSGVDWTSLYRVIIHRHADRLEILQHMLNATHGKVAEGGYNPKMLVQQVHDYVRSVLSPYIINGVKPHNESISFSWAAPVFENCAATHTKFISEKARLTRSEKLLLHAANGVLRETCRVIVGIWAEGVELGIKPGKPLDVSLVSRRRAHYDVALAWSAKIDGLMAWLDWSVWVKCRPACSFEETCYLPTWPFFGNRGSRPPPHKGDPRRPPGTAWVRGWGWVRDFAISKSSEGNDDEGEAEWIRPQPKCINRIPPIRNP